MKTFSRRLFILGFLAASTLSPRVGLAGSFSVGANGSPSNNPGLDVVWTLPTTNPALCPDHSQVCGYDATLTGSAISLGGWHGFGGGNAIQAQAFINALAPNYVHFNLDNASSAHIPTLVGAGICLPDQVCGRFPFDFRAPSADGGYFLWTSAKPGATSATSPFIRIGPSLGSTACSSHDEANCFDHFYMYWGSVDPWNTATFTDVWGNTYTVTGSNFRNDGLSVINGNNVNSIAVDFQATYTDSHGKTWPIPLESVKFQACGPSVNGSPACAPSFEFDNVDWTTCNGGCYGSNPVPGVPEPASWMLTSTGVGLLGGFVRRKLLPRKG